MRLLRTGEKEGKAFLEALKRRGDIDARRVETEVGAILEAVRQRGDLALVDYCRRFDGWECKPEQLQVPMEEVEKACQRVSVELVNALQVAADRIRRFHQRQLENSWFVSEEQGVFLGQKVTPLEQVGLYVPGGKAAYPSTVLMTAIPAQVAGVSESVLCCPAPGGEISPVVLAAARIAGVKRIFRVGGAQAIAALAYGTRTIPRVDKIVGPGNLYVAVAKKMVYGEVGIDSVAGPSEVLVVADESASPAAVAADLLAQAEHDEMALPLLITLSPDLGEKVRVEVERQLAGLSRQAVARRAWETRGAILVAATREEAVALVNEIAPEHLELAVTRAEDLLGVIRNAGAIFLGHWTPEALGDYAAGPNHVLPTGGTARFASPLGVYDFLKRSSILRYSAEALGTISGIVRQLAQAEGLEAHGRALEIRERGNSSASGIGGTAAMEDAP
ncbi:MAG: histidinol dehydrogenase [Candidatus Tectomicrobia bacterium]|uniref:Histidinol dehydrogenase n=1 Tax=Tectimicrobiota bacterium TaxID=2528274 RepID=A0A932M0H1_UNCTE|nr:histidinol dehydrogenase [Candidatus Tectomicrobia bacterium]